MWYLDSLNASRAALGLSTRLSAAGRARVIPDDILNHLEVWEPDALPATIRLNGASFAVLTSADVSPATRCLLAAYATSRVDFHVVEYADCE